MPVPMSDFDFKARDAVAQLWHVPGWYRVTSKMFNFMDGYDFERGLDLFIPDDVDDEKLGRAVRQGLGASRYIDFDDMPRESAAVGRKKMRAWEKLMLDRAGAERFSDIADLFEGTGINRDSSLISFTNYRVKPDAEVV